MYFFLTIGVTIGVFLFISPREISTSSKNLHLFSAAGLCCSTQHRQHSEGQSGREFTAKIHSLAVLYIWYYDAVRGHC